MRLTDDSGTFEASMVVTKEQLDDSVLKRWEVLAYMYRRLERELREVHGAKREQ
jgi:hypothetical protein